MPTRNTLVAEQRNHILNYTPVAGWGVFVLIMSLLPGKRLPGSLLDLNDHLIHAGIYVIWVILAIGGAIHWKLSRSGQGILIKAVLWAFVFGLTVEIAQATLTTTRHFELADLLANTIGAIAGALIFGFASRRMSKPE